MNFLAPAAFGLASLLLVILALYLLKLRRIEHKVSSLYLWRQMIQDREASAPWQRLHFNWLMMLQLLFLMLVITALARPFTWHQGVQGQAVIIVLDSSASMSAVDVEPNRFEAARKQARYIINDLPPSTRVTVIEAGNETQVHLTSSLDRAQALRVLDTIKPGNGSADLSMALELASAIASRYPDTQIILLSDGRSPLPDHLEIRGHLNYIPIGISDNNQAVSMLNVEPTAAGGWTIFVQVKNYYSQTAQRRLAIYADGSLVNAYDVQIPVGGDQSFVVSDLQDIQHIEVRLEGSDALALDDEAYMVARNLLPRRVTLVSQGSLFLKTALSLLPGVELTEIDTEDLKNSDKADVIIFDGVIPESVPESGSLWFIAPLRSTDFFRVTGSIQEPELRLFDPQDAMTTGISLSDIHLLDTAQIPLPDWAVPVIVGDTGGENIPLLFRGEPDGRRMAVLAFNITHSDLPLNAAFPVLCSNLMEWLAPAVSSAIPAAIRPGETITLPEGVMEAVVTRPDGHEEKIESDGPSLVLSDIDQSGIYRVRWGDDQQLDFAVNLYSPQESDINPADSLAGLGELQGEFNHQPQLTRKEIWRWLVIPALLLLMLEWMVYYRGGVKRLMDEIKNLMKQKSRFSKGFNK